jgi:hypothetical protein
MPDGVAVTGAIVEATEIQTGFAERRAKLHSDQERQEGAEE